MVPKSDGYLKFFKSPSPCWIDGRRFGSEEGSRRIRLGSYDCLFMIERIEGSQHEVVSNN
jgi:hypothetical protein